MTTTQAEPLLVDTSAYMRAEHAGWLIEAIEERRVYLCPLVELELGVTARGQADHTQQARRRAALLLRAEHTPADYTRAFAVQFRLARPPGQHRAVKPVDLVVAATAERIGATVVHYDRDYERIAAVTGQETRWVAPRGTL